MCARSTSPVWSPASCSSLPRRPSDTPAIVAAIALPAALALSPAAMAEPQNFVVDDEHFSMFFEIMHIGYAPVMG